MVVRDGLLQQAQALLVKGLAEAQELVAVEAQGLLAQQEIPLAMVLMEAQDLPHQFLAQERFTLAVVEAVEMLLAV